jgi:hypothetical protein
MPRRAGGKWNRLFRLWKNTMAVENMQGDAKALEQAPAMHRT